MQWVIMKRFNIVILLIFVFAAGLFYWVSQPQSLSAALESLATGEMQGFEVFDNPRIIPTFPFYTEAAEEISFSDFEGKVILANFWATWCAPCRYEMPSLARLQTKFPNVDFEVIIISIDREGFAATQPFLKEIGVEHLPSYLDQRSALALSIGAIGLPTTVLLDKDGVWLGRMVGPVEWDSEDAGNFVARAIKDLLP